MLEKGLIVAGIDPIHKGHISLIKIGLKEVKHIDFLVGNKQKHKLNYELRINMLELVLKKEKLTEKIHIFPLIKNIENRLYSLNPENYDSMILGSDVFNHFPPTNSLFKFKELKFFLKFPKLIILERKGIPVDEEVREYVQKRQEIIEYSSLSSVSSSKIRNKLKKGENICDMVPEYLLDLINSNINSF